MSADVKADGGDVAVAVCPQMVALDFRGGRFAAKDRKEAHANARLIAAAPDLLEACQRFAAFIPLLRTITVRQAIEAGDEAIDAAGLNPYCISEGMAEGTEPAISDWKLDAIRAAIARATGETP